MIYRFIGNPEFIENTLKDGQLWLSKVGFFNDPFEWIFRYKVDADRDKDAIWNYVKDNTHYKTEEYRLEKFKGYIENPDKLDIELNRIFKNFYNQGVCCFTEQENILNVIMWAYYADSHKGIALGFNQSELDLHHIDDFKGGVKIFKPKFKHVIYDDFKIYLNPFDKDRPNVLDTKYMKAKAWQHEKEVRLVSPKFGLHSFNKKQLKEVILGVNIDPDLKNKVLEILQTDKNYENVKVRFCSSEDNELKMKIEDIQLPTNSHK